MRTDQDDLRAVPLRSRCNVQVSPGHVVARRRPGYGPGMSRARGVHPVRNHEAMPANPLARGWVVGLEGRAGSDRSGRPSSSTTREVGDLMSSETEIRPFQVGLPEETIADLRRRIAATRWPRKELVADRSQGVQLATSRRSPATGRPITTGARARRG